MQAKTVAIRCLGLLTLASGCISPLYTRLPTLDPVPLHAEKRSFELHDPFPERDVGPDTQVRPRGFNDARSEPRRTLEGRVQLGPQTQIDRFAPPPPSSEWQYPNSVPQ